METKSFLSEPEKILLDMSTKMVDMETIGFTHHWYIQ